MRPSALTIAAAGGAPIQVGPDVGEPIALLAVLFNQARIVELDEALAEHTRRHRITPLAQGAEPERFGAELPQDP